LTYDPSKPVTPAVGPAIQPIDSHDKPAVKPADDDRKKADMPPATGVKRPPVIQPVNGDMPAIPRQANPHSHRHVAAHTRAPKPETASPQHQ